MKPMKPKKPAARQPAVRKKPAAAPAAPPASREEKIRRLLLLTGTAELAKHIIDNLMDTLAAQGSLPADFAEKFKERAEPHELIERVVPIYLRHLDDAMLDAATLFFGSTEGRRWSSTQIPIAQESTVVGQQWGIELAQRAMRALEEDARGIG